MIKNKVGMYVYFQSPKSFFSNSKHNNKNNKRPFHIYPTGQKKKKIYELINSLSLSWLQQQK